MDFSGDSSGYQPDASPNNVSIPPCPRASCSLSSHQDAPSASALPSQGSSFSPSPSDPPPSSSLFPRVDGTERRTPCRPGSGGESNTTELGEATQGKILHRFSRELSCSPFMPPWCLRRGYGTFPPGEGSGLPETILFKLVPPPISGVDTLHTGGAGGGGPAHKKKQHFHSRDVLDSCMLLDFMFVDLRSYQERRKILRNFILQTAPELPIQRDSRSRHGQVNNRQIQSSSSLLPSSSEKGQKQGEERISSSAEGDQDIGLNSPKPSHGNLPDFSAGVSASKKTPSQLYVQRSRKISETEQAPGLPGEISKVADTAGEKQKARHPAEGQDAVVNGEKNERRKEEEDRSGSPSTSIDMPESGSEVEMKKRKSSDEVQNEEEGEDQHARVNKETSKSGGGGDIDSSREESQVSGSHHSRKPEKKRDPGKPTSKSSGGGSSSSGLSAKGFGFQCFCVNTAGDTLVAACGNFLHIYHVPTKVLHVSIRLPSPSSSASSTSCSTSLLSWEHTYEKDRQPPEVHPLPPVKFLQFFDEDRLLLVGTGCGHVYIYFMLQAPQPALLSYINISEVYVHSMDRLPYLAGLPPLENDDLSSSTASSSPQSSSQLSDTNRRTAYTGQRGGTVGHTRESNSSDSFHRQSSHVLLTGIEPLEICYPPCVALGAQRCTDTWRIAAALAESVGKEDEGKGRSKSLPFPRIISTPEDTSAHTPFFLKSLDNGLSMQSCSSPPPLSERFFSVVRYSK